MQPGPVLMTGAAAAGPSAIEGAAVSAAATVATEAAAVPGAEGGHEGIRRFSFGSRPGIFLSL